MPELLTIVVEANLFYSYFIIFKYCALCLPYTIFMQAIVPFRIRGSGGIQPVRTGSCERVFGIFMTSANWLLTSLCISLCVYRPLVNMAWC